MPLPPSQKLKFERERGGMQPYADVYRFGGASTGAPLVLYIGGAIGREDYIARSSTPPDPIAAEFQRAFEVVAPGPVALLVCPCPIDIGGYDGFLDHFDQELVPAVGGSNALSCVGYSAGGPFATYVGVLSGGDAVAAYGAAGMKGVADEVRRFVESARRTGERLPTVRLYRNIDDRVEDPQHASHR